MRVTITKPADAALLRDIANACFDDAAIREPDGTVRVIAMSENAAHRLKALADAMPLIVSALSATTNESLREQARSLARSLAAT